MVTPNLTEWAFAVHLYRNNAMEGEGIPLQSKHTLTHYHYRYIRSTQARESVAYTQRGKNENKTLHGAFLSCILAREQKAPVHDLAPPCDMRTCFVFSALCTMSPTRFLSLFARVLKVFRCCCSTLVLTRSPRVTIGLNCLSQISRLYVLFAQCPSSPYCFAPEWLSRRFVRSSSLFRVCIS
jgi:hypothetical protein